MYLQFFSGSATEPFIWEGFSEFQRNAFFDTFDREFKPHGSSRIFETLAEAVERISSIEHKYDLVTSLVYSDSSDNFSSGDFKEKRWSLVTPSLLELEDEGEYSRTYFHSPPEEEVVAASVESDEPTRAEEPAPAIELLAAPNQADPMEMIVFRVKNSGGPVGRYVWTFGDGETAETPKPKMEHAYEKEGSYSVSVRAVGPDAEDAASLEDFVQIAYSVPLVSTFSVQPEDPVRDEVITFRSQS